MKSPLLLLSSMLDDFKRLDSGIKGLDRDFVTIKHRFEHEGFGFLSVTLPALCDSVDYGLSNGKFTCPTSFRKKRGSALPALLQGLLCEVFDIYGQLRPEASAYHVKMIREFLRAFKKVRLSSSKVSRLHEDAVRTFIETDEELLTFPSEFIIPPLLRRVSSKILLNLDLYREEDLSPKHGPGAVYEKHQGNGKWRSLLREILSPSFDVYDTPLDMFYANHAEHFGVPRKLSSSSVARLVTVPKTSTSLRSITVEPLLNQFFQQSLNLHLRQNIERCSILRESLALTRQDVNQKLALSSSITCKWSTIDLSSASDLLDTRLVNLVFGLRPRFNRDLMRFRTPYVDVGNFCLQLRKFAGMGNATTFPVQSVVFAVLGICAQLEQDGISHPSHRDVVTAARRIRVYGDDIIIRREYADALTRWLTLFRLKVNEKKSFFDGNFKESCGVDAFKGEEVHPVYIRSWPSSNLVSDDDLPNLVSTSNQFWQRGLYKTSDTIRNMVEASRPLPLVSSNSSSIGWHDRYDSSEIHSWDPDLHVYLVRGLVQKSKNFKDSLDGRAALLKSFLTPLIQRGVGHLSRSPKRYSTRLVKAWVPT